MNNTERPQVLIFGGTFNPPTLAHQAIMERCLELPEFKEVWVMPSGDRLDKQINVDRYDRLHMLELIKENEIKDKERLVISDFELKLPCPNQTYQTIAALALAYSDIDFWYTFGIDSYQDMPNWDHGESLQKDLNMVIFERGNSTIPEREGIIPLRIDYIGLSSTGARDAAARAMPLDDFVCQSVEKYIEENHLYQ